MTSIRQIRSSPWGHDTRKDSRQLIDSLTPALPVNVLSRLAVLSKRYSVQQVVLHINLKQLNEVLEKLNGDYIIPTVECGFMASEKHIKSFSKLCFDKSRLDKLLDYPLNNAKLDRYRDETTIGFQPSGLFDVVLRTDPPPTARTLRERFDVETIASMQVSGAEPHEAEEATHGIEDSGEVQMGQGHPENASYSHDHNVHTRQDSGNQVVGTTTLQQLHCVLPKQSNSLRDQTQTDKAPVAPDVSASGGSERAKANDQPSDASKDAHDNFEDTGHLRKAATTSKTQRTTQSKRKRNSSQGTAGAHGRPKRTPKPSRRAAEAASARRG
jgi:hypothetical protein